MPAPLRVVHAEDPKAQIRNAIGAYVERIHPLGVEILVGVYERGEQGNGDVRSKGGIILVKTETGTLREDKHQGKVGLVMKIGPAAFHEDENHRWGGQVPKIGDWVVFNVGDTFSYDLPGETAGAARRVRQVQDVDVHAIVEDPDIIY